MAEKFRLYRGLIVVFILLLAVVAAYLVGRNFNQPNGPGQTIPPISDSPGEKGGAPVQDEDQPPGLKIQLSDGGAQPETLNLCRWHPESRLSLEEINSILLRLPPLATDPDDRQAFKLPEEVLPPPRTGQTIAEPFPLPPEDTAPEVLAGPLEVLRYSPEGDVPLAPFVNVSFNQPMVPLATLEDLAKEDVPVVIEPTLPGTWRWLGTKTLNFQFDSELIDRMPMATEYTVTVPAGTTSAVGGVLAETVQFKFRTPPPTLLSSYPYSSEPQPLEPLFFISFDQRIDPGAVLETIKVEAEGRPVSVRLATDEEIEADEEVSRMVENAVEGRWLAFKARGTLPKDSNIQRRDRAGYAVSRGAAGHRKYSIYSFQPMRRSPSSAMAARGMTRIALHSHPFSLNLTTPSKPNHTRRACCASSRRSPA
jgi:alpha-2-macroglobulin